MKTLGKYELHEIIGTGGFGTVYRATNLVLEKEIALKVLHPSLTVDRESLGQFFKEARVAASLKNRHIVPIYDLGEYDGYAVIEMEYFPGGSLKDLLNKRVSLPYKEALNIAKQISQGLQAAHNKGLVHRDLKPANILFNMEGEVVLSDFGQALITQEISSDTSTYSFQPGILAGSPAYRAPELWRGKPPANPATDIYSFACAFYEMVVGQALFTGKTNDQLMTQHLVDGPQYVESYAESIPDYFRSVIEKATAKDQVDRYKTANDFFEALKGSIPNIKNPEEVNSNQKQDQANTRISNKNEPSPHIKEGKKGIENVDSQKRKPLLGLAIASTLIAVIGIAIGVAMNAGGIFKPTPITVDFQPNPIPEIQANPTESRENVPPQEMNPVIPSESLYNLVGSAEHPIKIIFVPSVDANTIVSGGKIMANALNKATGLTFEVSVPTSYAATIEEMCASPDDTFGFIPGLGYVLANQLCGVDVAFMAVRYGSPVYWTQVLVRRDSPYQTLKDLDGKTWGYTDPGSTSGYLVPLAMFEEAGIQPGSSLETGSHPNSVKAVYNGSVDFSTSFFTPPIKPDGEPAWKEGDPPDVPDDVIKDCEVTSDGKSLVCGGWTILDARANIRTEAPDVVEKVRILAISQGIPNDTISFGPEFPKDLRARIETALIDFANSDDFKNSVGSQNFYNWTGMTPARDADYAFVRLMVEAAGITIGSLGG